MLLLMLLVVGGVVGVSAGVVSGGADSRGGVALIAVDVVGGDGDGVVKFLMVVAVVTLCSDYDGDDACAVDGCIWCCWFCCYFSFVDFSVVRCFVSTAVIAQLGGYPVTSCYYATESYLNWLYSFDCSSSSLILNKPTTVTTVTAITEISVTVTVTTHNSNNSESSKSDRTALRTLRCL